MKEVYPLIRQEGRSPKLIPCGFLCQVIYLVLSDETPLNWARLPPLTCTGVCIPCTHAQRVAPSVLPPEQTCQVIYLVLSDETPLNWARLPPLTCTGVCIPCTHAQRVAPSVLPPEQTNFALSVPSVLQNSPPDYFAKRKTDA